MKKTYLFFLFLIFRIHTQWLPKIVWTYWQQQIPQQNHFLKAFTYNHQNMIQKEWQYRFLDKKNCMIWLDQIPQAKDIFKREQFQQKGQYSKRSMFIRLVLLKYFGGVWIDYSIILTQGLEWLFNLKQIDFINNKQYNNPEVFMIYNRAYNILLEIDDKEWGKNVILPRFEYFFIASSPNSWLISEWLGLYMLAKDITKKKNQLNKDKHDNQSQIIKIIQKQNIWTAGLEKQIKNEFAFAIQIIMQRRQRQLDNQWNKNGQKQKKKTVTNVHNIWLGQVYKIGYKLDAIQWSFPQLFMGKDIIELKQKNLFPNYFFKMTANARERFKRILDQPFLFVIENNNKVQKLCPVEAYFQKKSMIYFYMLKFYPKNFLQTNISKQNQKQNINNSICYKQAYKFLKWTQIDFSQKIEPFFFASKKQYKNYLQIFQGKKINQDMNISKIPFSIIKDAIKNAFPKQNYIFMLLLQNHSSINIRTFKETFVNKNLFAFTNTEIITIYYCYSYFQINQVQINGFQFFQIKIIGQNSFLLLYIFNNKHLEVEFEYIAEKKYNNSYEQLYPKIGYKFNQQIQKYRQKQVLIIKKICLISVIFIVIYIYYEKIKNSKKNSQAQTPMKQIIRDKQIL